MRVWGGGGGGMEPKAQHGIMFSISYLSDTLDYNIWSTIKTRARSVYLINGHEFYFCKFLGGGGGRRCGGLWTLQWNL